MKPQKTLKVRQEADIFQEHTCKSLTEYQKITPTPDEGVSAERPVHFIQLYARVHMSTNQQPRPSPTACVNDMEEENTDAYDQEHHAKLNKAVTLRKAKPWGQTSGEWSQGAGEGMEKRKALELNCSSSGYATIYACQNSLTTYTLHG